jgi:predicted AlkP superfamily phosphohydrolase/phosphomutase
MSKAPILAIGLDGYELSVAETMMAEGLLPRMKALREHSMRVLLEHGRAKYSGLTWEHFSSGRHPENGGRWSAVTFDPKTYHVRQDPTSLPPVFADLQARTVVFDVPYFDIAKATNVRGVTNWGAHDPGIVQASRPASLHEEIGAIFGAYPAPEYIYGFLWPSPVKTQTAAQALVRAIDMRADASRWLLAQRCPDWDLGIVVVSEGHSCIEPMWHGMDASHPLHVLPSASAAREGLREVYKAIDRLIGTLVDAFPAANVLLFAMHGMGRNEADAATMLLLGELLYRQAFQVPYMRDVEWSGFTATGVPLLPEDEHWGVAMQSVVPRLSPGSVTHPKEAPLELLQRLVTRSPRRNPTVIEDSNIDWMPTARYRPFWPHMDAFAIPAFYDGRVRINLKGREVHGTVPLHKYERAKKRIADVISECRNAAGERVVEEIYFPEAGPNSVGPTEADLYIVWQGAPNILVHPTLGTMGPVPYLRTGGHTGRAGFLYAMGDGIVAGDAGWSSAFDVLPTIVDMLRETPPSYVSGRPLRFTRGMAIGDDYAASISATARLPA